MSDNELLAAYANTNDEAAFVRLMERNSGLVYSSALRRTASPELAQEVLQNVFVALARKAGKLESHPAISGWLYVATMHESAKQLSKESNRKQKMRDYQSHQKQAAEAFDESIPTLDEAIDKLPTADRNLILQRFFERKSYREIAGGIGKTEAASRKQAERALGKLRVVLSRQGIVASASILGAALGGQLGKAAPSALVSTASKDVLTAVSAASAPGTLAILTMTLTQSKSAAVTGAALILAITGTAFWAGREHAHASAHPAGGVVTPSPGVARADVAPGRAKPGAELTQSQLLRLLTIADRDLHRLGIDSMAGYQAELRLRQIPSDQLAEALRTVAEEMPGGLAEHLALGRYLLQFWAENDGDAAMAFAYENLSPKDLKKSVGRILKPWADRNPTATLAWYRDTYDSDIEGGIQSHAEKEAQLRVIFGSWAIADAPAAIAEYQRMSSPDERRHAARGMVSGIANESHRAEVFAFITGLGDQRLRLVTIHQAAKLIATDEPVEAVALFESAELSPDEARYAAHGIYEMWHLAGDPESAARWFVSQSMTDEGFGDRIAMIAGQWMDTNPDACHEWLSQFEFDAGMDRNLASIALHFDMNGRRGIALDWQLKITDPEVQAFALQNTLNNWAKEDAAAAREWFETAGLDTGVAEAVEGMVTWNTP